ncbi:MAG: preprotein translocase subunit SecE [Thermaurantiacus tibetensis]|uniref:preprotein translocase subunit SecE n=1 Tax=Thermaurantiacus tibetensis TaxID=2759035 RepID=UPI00188E3D73|nr:preprotein translocase subunit SecE [Thermaurantiacus tibetensis]
MADEAVQKVEKSRVSPGEFVRQVRAETAKVVWPSRRETVQTTILVLVMTSLLALFFLGVDQILGRVVKFLLSLGGA